MVFGVWGKVVECGVYDIKTKGREIIIQRLQPAAKEDRQWWWGPQQEVRTGGVSRRDARLLVRACR